VILYPGPPWISYTKKLRILCLIQIGFIHENPASLIIFKLCKHILAPLFDRKRMTTMWPLPALYDLEKQALLLVNR